MIIVIPKKKLYISEKKINLDRENLKLLFIILLSQRFKNMHFKYFRFWNIVKTFQKKTQESQSTHQSEKLPIYSSKILHTAYSIQSYGLPFGQLYVTQESGRCNLCHLPLYLYSKLGISRLVTGKNYFNSASCRHSLWPPNLLRLFHLFSATMPKGGN